MQLKYTQTFDKATPGFRADMGPMNVESHASCDPVAIGYGTGLVWGLITAGTIRAPKLNQSVATLSTDLITSNSVIVTVNGVATSATVYASSHSATMTAIAVKVAALAGVTACTTTGDTLTVKTGDTDTVLAVAVTLGASQPTVTYAASSVDTYAGLAEFEYDESTLEGIGSATAASGVGASAGQGFLQQNSVPTVRMGRHFVPVVVGSAIANGTVAYMITAATNRGYFTDTSTGNIKAGIFRDAPTTLADGTTIIAKIQTDAPALN